jgi:hypothetical protein
LTLKSAVSNEKTEVFHGEENARKILLQTISNVQKEVLVCADSNSAAFSMDVASIKKGYSDFKRRGVRIRFITEITSQNLQYVKELTNYAQVLDISIPSREIWQLAGQNMSPHTTT